MHFLDAFRQSASEVELRDLLARWCAEAKMRCFVAALTKECECSTLREGYQQEIKAMFRKRLWWREGPPLDAWFAQRVRYGRHSISFAELLQLVWTVICKHPKRLELASGLKTALEFLHLSSSGSRLPYAKEVFVVLGSVFHDQEDPLDLSFTYRVMEDEVQEVVSMVCSMVHSPMTSLHMNMTADRNGIVGTGTATRGS